MELVLSKGGIMMEIYIGLEENEQMIRNLVPPNFERELKVGLGSPEK